jgi:hypothetical protein
VTRIRKFRTLSGAWAGGKFPLTCGITEEEFIEWAFPRSDALGDLPGRRHLDLSLPQMPYTIMRAFCVEDCQPWWKDKAMAEGTCNAETVLDHIDWKTLSQSARAKRYRDGKNGTRHDPDV